MARGRKKAVESKPKSVSPDRALELQKKKLDLKAEIEKADKELTGELSEHAAKFVDKHKFKCLMGLVALADKKPTKVWARRYGYERNDSGAVVIEKLGGPPVSGKDYKWVHRQSGEIREIEREFIVKGVGLNGVVAESCDNMEPSLFCKFPLEILEV